MPTTATVDNVDTAARAEHDRIQELRIASDAAERVLHQARGRLRDATSSYRTAVDTLKIYRRWEDKHGPFPDNHLADAEHAARTAKDQLGLAINDLTDATRDLEEATSIELIHT